MTLDVPAPEMKPRYETDMQKEKKGRSIRPIKDLNFGRPDVDRDKHHSATISCSKGLQTSVNITSSQFN
jgi:hypothetical protein